jgi:hypothetical protein
MPVGQRTGIDRALFVPDYLDQFPSRSRLARPADLPDLQ